MGISIVPEPTVNMAVAGALRASGQLDRNSKVVNKIEYEVII